MTEDRRQPEAAEHAQTQPEAEAQRSGWLTALEATAAGVEILKDGPRVIANVAEKVSDVADKVKEWQQPTGKHAAGPENGD
jgi:hypothetical protein